MGERSVLVGCTAAKQALGGALSSPDHSVKNTRWGQSRDCNPLEERHGQVRYSPLKNPRQNTNVCSRKRYPNNRNRLSPQRRLHTANIPCRANLTYR